MDSFPARYHTRCKPCDEDIKPGEYIVMHPDAGAVHEECVEDVGKGPETSYNGREPFPRARAPINVLPHGKTAKDSCDFCFMIHSLGQEGCEW